MVALTNHDDDCPCQLIAGLTKNLADDTNDCQFTLVEELLDSLEDVRHVGPMTGDDKLAAAGFAAKTLAGLVDAIRRAAGIGGE